MKYLILLLLLGCSTYSVNSKGVTDEVVSNRYRDMQMSENDVKGIIRVLCINNSYEKYRILKMRTIRIRFRTSGLSNWRTDYVTKAIGQCLKKVKNFDHLVDRYK